MGSKYEKRIRVEVAKSQDLYEQKVELFHQFFEPYLERFVEFSQPQSPQDELFSQILFAIRDGNDAQWQTLADSFFGKIRFSKPFQSRADFYDFFEKYVSENFEELLDYACFEVASRLLAPFVQEIVESHAQSQSEQEETDFDDDSQNSFAGGFGSIQQAERAPLPSGLSDEAVAVCKIYELINADEVSEIDLATAFSELYRLFPDCSDYLYDFCVNYSLLSAEVFANKRDELISGYEGEILSLRQQIMELENELEDQVGGDILVLEEESSLQDFPKAHHSAWKDLQQASQILTWLKERYLYTSEQWLRSRKALGLASDQDPHFKEMVPLWQAEDQRILRPLQEVHSILRDVEYDLGILPIDILGDDFSDQDFSDLR